MKKIIITVAATFLFAVAATAQCDSTINLKSSTQERLNEKDEVVKSENDVATITITKNKLVINRDNGENILEGTITKKSCDWKTFLKEGKATYELTTTGPDGNLSSVKAWVEAKAGKPTFYLQMGDRKIRALID